MPFPTVPLAMMGGSALLGGLSSLFSKRGKFQPGRWDRQNLLTPQQQAAQNQFLQMGMQGLQNANQDPYAGFEPIEQNAMSQFNSQIIPSIAERFTGSQRSSGFQSALQQGAQGLASNLAAQRAQYGLQNRQLQQNDQRLAQSLLGMGMQPSFQYSQQQYIPGGHTGFSGALSGLSSALGQAADMPGINELFSGGGQQQTPGARSYNNAPMAPKKIVNKRLAQYANSSAYSGGATSGELGAQMLGSYYPGYGPGNFNANTALGNNVRSFGNTYQYDPSFPQQTEAQQYFAGSPYYSQLYGNQQPPSPGVPAALAGSGVSPAQRAFFGPYSPYGY
jgi:hypothetical protein